MVWGMQDGAQTRGRGEVRREVRGDFRGEVRGQFRGGSPLTGVRGLVLGWCLWLLGSWGSTLSIAATVPAVRWMVYASMLGMLLIWPTYRLCLGPMALRYPGQPPTLGADARAVLLDWLALNAVLQAVLWPLKLSADWTPGQTLWLVGAMAGWSLVTGVVIVLGRAGGSLRRFLAMLACVLLVFGEPIVSAVWGLATPGQLSPIGPIWVLTQPPTLFESVRQIDLVTMVLTVGVAGVVGWAMVGLWILLAPRVPVGR